MEQQPEPQTDAMTACSSLDQSDVDLQVVVDRPDMVRTSFLTKRLAITDLKVEVNRLAKKKELTAAFDGAPQHTDCELRCMSV